MIKIGLKIFIITSLFCLLQHFPVMKSVTFIQNFGNCSFYVSGKRFIVSESITTRLKAIE